MLIDYCKKLDYKGTAWLSYRGNEPIHCATSWGNLECLQLLVQKGATINLKNSYWETLLHLAAYLRTRMKNGLPVLRFLLALGVDINALTTTGDTPILMAARVGNKVAIKELLESLPSPVLDQQGQFGERVLLAAASRCSARTMQRLVVAGADIHFRSTKLNISALHLAAEAGNISSFKWILDNSNLTINDMDCHNWTPLHYTACRNQVAMAKYLLEHGADLSIASNLGYHTPLHLAQILMSVLAQAERQRFT
jgi:ankyrin repeat protein